MKDYPFLPNSFQLPDGNTISYLDEGEGPAVVMLHGNPTWSFYFRKLVETLRDKYRLIVPDHLGCGLSSKPQDYPYRLRNHIDNLEKLLTYLDLKEHTLIFHDWGGAIGVGYAGRHPEKINALVVLNTAAFPAPRMPFRIRLCRLPILGELLVRGLNCFAGTAPYMAVTAQMDPDVTKQYLTPYNSWVNRIAIHRFVKDIPMNSKHPSWQTLLEVEAGLAHFVDTPMLIAWGGKDFCFNEWFYKEWLRRFPNSETKYFPNAGHYVLEDASDQVNPLIRDFLERRTGGQ